MDRATLEEHLAQSKRHVAEGKLHIARQLELIGGLERGGHDTTIAFDVLTTLRETQASHQQSVERILRQLEQ
jgi:hypothetical protein